ncbi:4888_t:CDS:2 [Funneliformis mosseae]|uniref:4888_t:CDS:1 n=1 Tax=Funneliformis mosseae TaxID=27381 RepID=A0A9N9BDY5_FUNMO|nr:4888_t:CDS:2 [Funneliformis mosseae]
MTPKPIDETHIFEEYESFLHDIREKLNHQENGTQESGSTSNSAGIEKDIGASEPPPTEDSFLHGSTSNSAGIEKDIGASEPPPTEDSFLQEWIDSNSAGIEKDIGASEPPPTEDSFLRRITRNVTIIGKQESSSRWLEASFIRNRKDLHQGLYVVRRILKKKAVGVLLESIKLIYGFEHEIMLIHIK